jgi:hypothetical protein
MKHEGETRMPAKTQNANASAKVNTPRRSSRSKYRNPDASAKAKTPKPNISAAAKNSNLTAPRRPKKPQLGVRINLAFSRSQFRFFSVSRLSCCFLPLASPISHLTRPFL